MPTATQRRRRGRSRDEEGRFEGDWSQPSGYEGEEDWEPGPIRRGFISREPERRGEAVARGGWHRPERRNYQEDYDYDQPRSRRQRVYEEKQDYEMSGRGRSWTGRRGFAAMNPERQREIAAEGGRAPHRGPRGFAAMDENEQREIAAEGGRAPHRGPRGFAAMDQDEQREIASRGGRAPHRGPRGFAAMNENEQREIAARGGHASRGGWGGDYEEENYEASGRGRRSRRGFTAINPGTRRRIGGRGGRSSRRN